MVSFQVGLGQPGLDGYSPRQRNRREPRQKSPPLGQRETPPWREGAKTVRASNHANRARHNPDLLGDVLERAQVALRNGGAHGGRPEVERPSNTAELMRHG